MLRATWLEPDCRFPCPSAWLGDMLARLQVRYPEVQVVFADSRKFAEEWTYRFLAAALADSIGSDVAR
jgi:hypothetical protein